MLTGWRAVTTLICLVLILSFGVRVLKQWIALRKIGRKNVTIFVCPPPHLIRAVLYQMKSCKAKGTLVVPEWKSAPFRPLLCSFDRPLLFQDFVKDFCCRPKSRDMFVPGRGSSLFILSKRSGFFVHTQV